MKKLTLNCFSFTLNAFGMLSTGETLKIEELSSESIYRLITLYSIEQVILIGPTVFTSKLSRELIGEYGFSNVHLIGGVKEDGDY